MGLYDTIEAATQARVQRARQAFGQFANSCKGINFGAKPMKIRKVKPIVVQPIVAIKPIVKNDIQKIYENIVQLNDALKLEIMKL